MEVRGGQVGRIHVMRETDMLGCKLREAGVCSRRKKCTTVDQSPLMAHRLCDERLDGESGMNSVKVVVKRLYRAVSRKAERLSDAS